MKTIISLFFILTLSFGQQIKTIHTDEFYQILPFSLVIDLRSPTEYGIAHIKGAHNIPINSASFQTNIINLLSETSARQLVVYGNDKAQAQKAGGLLANLVECFVYPQGLQNWFKKHPQFSLLFGQRFNPKKVISEKKLQQAMLTSRSFKRKARSGFTILLEGDKLKSHSRKVKETPQPLRAFARKVEAGDFKGQALYLAGLSPAQSLWIMYLLQENGIKNFGFLK